MRYCKNRKVFSSNMFRTGGGGEGEEDYNFLARCRQIHFNNISFPVTKELIVVQALGGDGERTDLQYMSGVGAIENDYRRKERLHEATGTVCNDFKGALHYQGGSSCMEQQVQEREWLAKHYQKGSGCME
jgi:hypothetical protein